MFKFTKETAVKLRQIRENSGLTQSEVASRMKLKSKSGQIFIARLENGMIKNPALTTILNYLTACGVSWSNFFAELSAKEFNKQHEVAVRKALLNRTDGLNYKLEKKIDRDTAKYGLGIKRKKKGAKPLSEEKQQTMVGEFAKFRVFIEPKLWSATTVSLHAKSPILHSKIVMQPKSRLTIPNFNGHHSAMDKSR